MIPGGFDAQLQTLLPAAEYPGMVTGLKTATLRQLLNMRAGEHMQVEAGAYHVDR